MFVAREISRTMAREVLLFQTGHGAGLEVHEDRARHVAAAGRLVVVHVDALQLEVAVAVVRAGRVHAVLVGDDLPELGADLVAALAALDVNDFAHLGLV